MLRRWNSHVYTANRLKGDKPAVTSHFANAIRKYGKDAFEHEVLEVCHSVEAANAAERCWIEKLDSTNPEKGFNLMRGGSHTPHHVRNPWDRPEYRAKKAGQSKKIWSDPVRRLRASAIMKEVWERPEFRERIETALKGIPLTPEHRVKVSASMRGNVVPLKVRQKISGSQKGRPRNPDSIAKSAASRKGIKFSDEHRANIGNAQRGRKHSPEHVAAVSKALRSRPRTTRCKHGHSLEDAYFYGGRRFCRMCQKQRSAEYHERKKRCGAAVSTSGVK